MPKEKLNEHKRGNYTVEIFVKGKNECLAMPHNLKDGEVFYTIWNNKHSGIDTLNQDSAIIMSSQIRIEDKLNKLLKGK